MCRTVGLRDELAKLHSDFMGVAGVYLQLMQHMPGTRGPGGEKRRGDGPRFLCESADAERRSGLRKPFGSGSWPPPRSGSRRRREG